MYTFSRPQDRFQLNLCAVRVTWGSSQQTVDTTSTQSGPHATATNMTSRRLILALTCLCLAISSTHALELPMQHAQPNVFAGDVLALHPTNVSLSAPCYRNVTNGSVWVIPSSAFDLGARDMSCECFDPDRKHPSIPHLLILHHSDYKLIKRIVRDMLHGRHEIDRSLLHR